MPQTKSDDSDAGLTVTLHLIAVETYSPFSQACQAICLHFALAHRSLHMLWPDWWRCIEASVNCLGYQTHFQALHGNACSTTSRKFTIGLDLELGRINPLPSDDSAPRSLPSLRVLLTIQLTLLTRESLLRYVTQLLGYEMNRAFYSAVVGSVLPILVNLDFR